jgi:hypothetical protein
VQKPWQRIQEQRRWVYLVAAIPALLTAVYGMEAGAFLPYAAVAAAFALCYIYPTVVGWWIAFGAYCAATAVSLQALVRDVHRLTAGGKPGILTDSTNSWVAMTWIGCLLLVTGLLWHIRPWRDRATT